MKTMLAMAAAAAMLLWSGPAQGQLGVRPSKGVPVAVFENAGNGAHTSTVYDWTGFSGLVWDAACPAGADTIQVQVQGAQTGAGPWAVVESPNNQPTIAATSCTPRATAVVRVTTPYVRFVLTVVSAASLFTLTITPVPFDPIVSITGPTRSGIETTNTTFPVLVGGRTVGFQSTTSIQSAAGGSLFTMSAPMNISATLDTVVAVTNAAGGTSVATASASTVPVRSTTVQNLGTVTLACSVGGVPVIGTKGTVLAAGTAANDGTGGSQTWDNYTGAITCIASGAGGSAAVQRW